MTDITKLEPFIQTGEIAETIPYKKDIRYENGDEIVTIKNYYPSPGAAHSLTTSLKPDPDNAGEYIIQYVDPFGPGWDINSKNYLKALEFVFDDDPGRQYLVARNVKEVRIGQPDRWEIEEFIIFLLGGGQLSVWTRWEQPDVDGGDPLLYLAGYIWPRR